MTTKADKPKIKNITVQAAEKALKEGDTQLFVMNKTGIAGTDFAESGNINITVNQDGQNVSVIAPVTWVPFDLSLFASKDVILRNANFRRIVSRGLIVILDSNESNEFYSTNERAHAVLNKLLGAVGYAPDEANGEKTNSINELNPTAPPASENVSMFVQNIVIRATSEDVNDLISELEDKEANMHEDEFAYIVNNSTDGKLKEWAALALDVRKA